MKQTYIHHINGLKLTAEVSPCVFMHKGYPLQLTVKNPNGGDTIIADRTKNAETFTDADCQALLQKVGVVSCKDGCGRMAFDPATCSTNRGGVCEVCFMAKLRAELAVGQAKEEKRLVARDKRMVAKGMKFRVTAWVHPKRGGDDYQVDVFYSTKPSDAEVRTMLATRSSVVDDFKIIDLSA